MKRYVWPVSAVLGLLLVSAALFIWSKPAQVPQGERTNALAKVRIVTSSSASSGLIFVAARRGFFRDAGLDVTFSKKLSGKAALQAMLDGEADMATTSEIPVVHAWLGGTEVPVVTTIFTSTENNHVVARRDRGIARLSDLKGKRIGVTKGTDGEYSLDALLALNGISPAEVTLVHLSPGKMADALINGDVDAICTWNIHVLRAQQALGDRQVSFSTRDVYTTTFNLVAVRGYLARHAGEVERVLRALVRASAYMRAHPVEARAAVAEEAGMDPGLLGELWGSLDYQVRLDQNLILAMESEAAWMSRNGLTSSGQTPNFYHAVYLDGLLKVAPEKVTVIH